jgi:hypothetical protein
MVKENFAAFPLLLTNDTIYSQSLPNIRALLQNGKLFSFGHFMEAKSRGKVGEKRESVVKTSLKKKFY